MPEHREPFGRHAVFAGPDLHRVARHHADRHEDQEDQRRNVGMVRRMRLNRKRIMA